jgi:hypothetical protein
MHKLTAGSGYDYLTRQVAALDSTEKGHAGLASYYTERASHRGVDRSRLGRDRRPDRRRPGDHRADPRLFGCGLHPLAELRQQQLEGPDLPQRDLQDAARLGAPFKIVDSVVSLFRLEVAKRIGAIQTAAGIPAGVPLPATDRARVRTEVAANTDGSGLRLDVLPGEVSLDPVGSRRTGGGSGDRTRPLGRREGRVGVH